MIKQYTTISKEDLIAEATMMSRKHPSNYIKYILYSLLDEQKTTQERLNNLELGIRNLTKILKDMDGFGFKDE